MAGSHSHSNAARKPPLPWTVRLKLVLLLPILYRPDSFLRRLLVSFIELQQVPAPHHPDVRSADVTIDASRGLWARVFSPSSSSATAADSSSPPPPLPVVVYFHGGGFVFNSAASRPYDALCRRLCSSLNAVVVSVDYRRAPQHRFPAAYDDALAALRYLDDDVNTATVLSDLVGPLHVDLSSCFLAGDSSGGNIVHHVAQRWASTSSSRLHVAGAVLIQPFFGGEERTGAELALDKACRSLSLEATDYYWREFLPVGATRDHAAARVCGDGVEVAPGFPPALVVVGGFDLLKDWQARYVETLRAKGKKVRVVEYPDAVHGFYMFPELADSGRLMEEVKLFVDAHRSKQ
ncbi:hypothetical protein PR202_ga28992 [Eleusine coracana subsp. coracana]|uniref:Alpha/beta hydrolase fold-3 domain-containing protein n=1 Tax=Eleusine coracana subsp. coracana TaxID=191504 RepID=A0AAV5DKW3_ELECO|nr:hypothetical protein QOZ80_7AG0579360 [Eleusine coracana subsp. coracana]GJN10856.1 hypothetical protein PR202_ga28992 [Eleusine coracana subsp. coracana]